MMNTTPPNYQDWIVAETLKLMRPFIDFIDGEKFVVNDEKINSKEINVANEFIICVFAILRSCAWIEDYNFIALLLQDCPDEEPADIEKEIEDLCNEGLMLTCKVNDTLWIKLSPKGDFEVNQSLGVPTYQ